MKILITGGAGRVGSELIKILRDKHEITHFETHDPQDGLPFIIGDLRDAQAVEKVCEGMDAIIHLAAVFNGKNRKWDAVGDEAAFAINVNGTRNILDGAHKHQVKRVVFTSSVVVGGGQPTIDNEIFATESRPYDPWDMYAVTKVLCEQLCDFYAKHKGLNIICLRPGPIFPPEMYKERIWNMLEWSVDARDVALAHALAVEADESITNEIFNITSDSPLNQVDPQEYKKDPIGTLEKLFPGISTELPENSKESLKTHGWYSIDKAKKMLNYQPQYNFAF